MKLVPQLTGNAGLISYWLQPTSYDQPQFHEKWDRIGHG